MQVPWSKRVGTKLMISYLIVAAVIVGIAIYSFWAMTAIDSKTTSLYMDNLQPLELLGEVSTAAYRMRGDMYKYLLLPDARPNPDGGGMANLALLDLVLPYLFRGENLGPSHAALSALRVVIRRAQPPLAATMSRPGLGEGTLDRLLARSWVPLLHVLILVYACLLYTSPSPRD